MLGQKDKKAERQKDKMNKTKKTSRRYIQNLQVSTPVWQYFANVKFKL